MGELANCTRCDELFVKTLRDICKNCYDEEEIAFKKVVAFLRVKKNREATMAVIVEETDVSEKLITKFIKEKRLLTSQFQKLAYRCETCDKEITSGKICLTCSEKLLRDLANESYEEEREKRLKVKKDEHSTIYYSFKKDR